MTNVCSIFVKIKVRVHILPIYGHDLKICSAIMIEDLRALKDISFIAKSGNIEHYSPEKSNHPFLKLLSTHFQNVSFCISIIRNFMIPMKTDCSL